MKLINNYIWSVHTIASATFLCDPCVLAQVLTQAQSKTHCQLTALVLEVTGLDDFPS